MTDWYSLRPIDTLFFRGAEPMNRGEQHVTSSHFPPQTSTLEGAVRTTYLIQKGISFKDYNMGIVDTSIIDEIGASDRAPNFYIIGPLVSKNEFLFIPAPYSWYTDDPEIKKIEDRDNQSVKLKIRKGEVLDDAQGLIFSEYPLLWVKKPESEMKSLGGYWIKLNDLYKNKSEKCEVFSTSYFITNELHTGIALTKSRIVHKGHLYTFNHTRLHEDVLLCFGIEPSISLEPEGIMKIGAEQRFGMYKKIENINIPVGKNGSKYSALSRVAGTEQVNNAVIATGKIQYIGGYDLARGFHKPMRGYFPAGTVFNKKVIHNCIALY